MKPLLLAGAVACGAGCAHVERWFEPERTQCITAAPAALRPVDERSHVTGTVNYRQRVALPGNATLEVTLLEVSKTDAAAEQVGSTRILRPGQVPICFAVPYEPGRIKPQNAYTLHARIMAEGKPLFASSVYPVLTHGRPDHVEMMLDMVESAPR
jgi:putative lipoprotein